MAGNITLICLSKIILSSWALVAHACNPNYLGGLWFEASLGK
jgi:hypothetical protein